MGRRRRRRRQDCSFPSSVPIEATVSLDPGTTSALVKLSARVDEVGAEKNSLLRIHTWLRVFVEGVVIVGRVEN